jgi:hypothetical protein
MEHVAEFIIPDFEAILISDVELAKEFLGGIDTLGRSFHLEPGITAGEFDFEETLDVGQELVFPGV